MDDEEALERDLCGRRVSNALATLEDGLPVIETRLEIDAQIKSAAVAQGYDAVVLLSPSKYDIYLSSGKIPRSIKLNIVLPAPQPVQDKCAA